MIKKLFSSLLIIVMLCMTFAIVSYASTNASFYYEPGNVMVTGYHTKAETPFARLSWKNPLSDNLSSVKVYSVADGTETLISTINSPVPGAVSYVDETKEGSVANKVSGTATYRLIFDFSDGQKRNILYTGSWGINKAVGMTDIGWTINPMEGNGIGALETYAGISKEEAVSGSHSLKIESNMSEITGTRCLQFYTGPVFFTAGAKYKGTVKVKTSDSAQFAIGSPSSPLITVTGSNEWQDIQIPEFTGHTNGKFYLYVKSTTRELYLDDIVINAVDSATALQNMTETFDNTALDGGYTAPTNVVAKGGNACVDFTWDTIATGAYIRIFEETEDGKLLLRANVSKSESGTTVYGLENDVEYKFVLKTYGNSFKSESAATIVYATPIAPDYELGTPVLTLNNVEADSLADGIYSATCDVKNNKVSDGIDAQLLVAIYDGYKLVKCYASAKETLAVASDSVTLKIENIILDDSVNKDYNVRVMLWSELGDVAPWRESTLYTE